TTDIDAMALLCFFHHKLVHEYGWWAVWDPVVRSWIWYQPGGVRYTGVPPPLEFAPDPEWNEATPYHQVLADLYG
ncbi:MAG: hypothetical protein LC792_25890, partial [Actinobacteria bacterium]|nr:hypothetical protein [Actinomycetota bacterium]